MSDYNVDIVGTGSAGSTYGVVDGDFDANSQTTYGRIDYWDPCIPAMTYAYYNDIPIIANMGTTIVYGGTDGGVTIQVVALNISGNISYVTLSGTLWLTCGSCAFQPAS